MNNIIWFLSYPSSTTWQPQRAESEPLLMGFTLRSFKHQNTFQTPTSPWTRTLCANSMWWPGTWATNRREGTILHYIGGFPRDWKAIYTEGDEVGCLILQQKVCETMNVYRRYICDIHMLPHDFTHEGAAARRVLRINRYLNLIHLFAI